MLHIYFVYLYMNKISLEDKQAGIYAIKNLTNNKLYIGKSKNIYKRIYSHMNSFKIFLLNGTNQMRANRHLLNSIKKYGIENFEYYVLEYTSIDKLSISEINWILKLRTNKRHFGYNLQLDSEDSVVVSKETSEKISKRLKEEWKNGVRSQHSEKMKLNWRLNPDYKYEKSKLFSKTLTKYKYGIYKDDTLIEVCYYNRLCELGFKNAIASFARTKSDTINCKKHIIKRMKI